MMAYGIVMFTRCAVKKANRASGLVTWDGTLEELIGEDSKVWILAEIACVRGLSN